METKKGFELMVRSISELQLNWSQFFVALLRKKKGQMEVELISFQRSLLTQMKKTRKVIYLPTS